MVWKEAQGITEDVWWNDYCDYRKRFMGSACPPDQLDVNVSDLLCILLGRGDDNEMATKIRELHNSKKLHSSRKRLPEDLERHEPDSELGPKLAKRQKTTDE
jgi:hypothetical protein